MEDETLSIRRLWTLGAHFLRCMNDQPCLQDQHWLNQPVGLNEIIQWMNISSGQVGVAPWSLGLTGIQFDVVGSGAVAVKHPPLVALLAPIGGIIFLWNDVQARKSGPCRVGRVIGADEFIVLNNKRAEILADACEREPEMSASFPVELME